MKNISSYEDFIKMNTEAEQIALAAHDRPKYGNLSVADHLRDVIRVLNRFGFRITSEVDFDIGTAEILVAAWLHDIIEDTALERSHLVFHFGERIGELAWRVADEPGDSRQAKILATLPKIRADKSAVILKLADRIANVEVARRLRRRRQPKLWEKYHREQALFRQQLYRAGEIDEMWVYLEKLLS